MHFKHINDLVIGDEVVIEIPTVCSFTDKVVFVNKEQKFIFLESCVDIGFDGDYEAYGIKFIPNQDGYFKVQ